MLFYFRYPILKKMQKSAQVYIDPSIKVLYSSYYIQGLYDFYGKDNVHFSAKPFNGLKKREDKELYDHYMAFVVKKDDQYKRYIIDFWDKTIIDENAYNWCDRYAKINNTKEVVFEKEKLIVIPPGFGIKIWNKKETIKHCLCNFLRSKRKPHIKLKRHYEDYIDQFERPAIQDYESPSSSAPKTKTYVFMIGRLWPHKNCLTTTNPLRLRFIETCKKLNVDFEGGLFASPSHPDYEQYKHVAFTKKMDVFTYVEKTKQSAIAFNTPAVHDCHGWKLGEYLAMGKAIISTKLSNYFPLYGSGQLPLHTILDTDNIEEDLTLLLHDENYREELSTRAQNYYQEHASPKKVIEKIVE